MILKAKSDIFVSTSTFKANTKEAVDGSLTLDSNDVYYISRRGDQFGLAFYPPSINNGKPIKINIDSLVQSRLGAPAFFYKLRSKGKDSISIERDETKELLVEKYVYRRREVQEPDSLYFYFRKQLLEVSFNMKEQRKDGMRLYKARAICNATLKGRFPNVPFDVKKYEHSFEIKEVDVPEEEIKAIIEKFNRAIE